MPKHSDLDPANSELLLTIEHMFSPITTEVHVLIWIGNQPLVLYIIQVCYLMVLPNLESSVFSSVVSFWASIIVSQIILELSWSEIFIFDG